MAAIRITPAYAGKSYVTVYNGNAYWDHPRLCGEKSSSIYFLISVRGSPPPMRGKVTEAGTVTKEDRITPAYAGKSNVIASTFGTIQDHPRLCGEKLPHDFSVHAFSGSPPPMRGKADLCFSL